MHFSCIRTFNSLFYDIDLVHAFLCVSFSLSFLHELALWHLNANLLCLGTLFVPRHLLLLPLLTPLHLTSGSVMIKPVRTFPRTSYDEEFVRNAKTFYWIVSILTFLLSSTVGVGSDCVASQSLVPS